MRDLFHNILMEDENKQGLLTNQFVFQPEEIIEIEGVTYAVYYDIEELGNFPILAKVDSPTFITVGVEPTVLTQETFATKYGYVFRGHEDLLVSEILTGDEEKEYRGVFDTIENKFETQAKENGMKWLLDRDVQAAFLAASLTGTPISTDDLSGTEWYENSTEEQRNFMIKYYLVIAVILIVLSFVIKAKPRES
jgi:predicted nucleic acid-binding Zn ribbon protein